MHRQISDLLRALPANAGPDLERLGLAGALRQAVAREVEGRFEGVSWQVEPEAEARSVPPHAAEVVYYAAREAIRNAARYAQGNGLAHPLRLRIAIAWRGGLQVVVEDNGVGIAGAQPTGGGSGQGLALHSTMMAVIGGSLSVESLPGRYTRVTLFLPQP